MRKTTLLCSLALVLAAVSLGNPSAISLKDDLPTSGDGFDRAETLVVNLNKRAGSSGYYLLEGLRFVETMDHDLLKALRQVQEVDKTYAKLRGKPDNKYLEVTALKIEKAIASNTQLRADLRDAYSELKDQIKDTLIMDAGLKKN
jgi:hypothetical protein